MNIIGCCKRYSVWYKWLAGFSAFGMSQPVLRRLVRSDSDMLDIEKCIIGELGGENHRCAFFRTLAYIRLRIAALYLPAKMQHIASYSDLNVVLTPTDEGSVVTVTRRFNEPLLEAEDGPTADCQRKRMRAEGLV